MKRVQSSNLADSLDLLQRYILAVVGAQNKAPIREKLWLQKEIFLIANANERLKDASCFSAHLQGPFSEAVDSALDDLRNLGLVSYDTYGGHISLTPSGNTAYQELVGKMPKQVLDQVEDIKTSFNDMTENELLVFVYYSYPGMTEESVHLEKVRKNRIPASISLYKKDKVSLEKAAKLAGMSLLDFRKMVGGEEHHP